MAASKGRPRQVRAAAGRTSPSQVGVLARELEELGLSPYEARVLLALLRLGPSNTLQLTRVSEVPRTSAYQILESLSAKGLAERLPGEGSAVWTSPGPEEVLERLDAAQEEQLRQHRLRAGRVRQMLEEVLPEQPEIALPYIHFIPGAAQVKRVFDQLWAKTDSEVLAFSRPPYSWTPGEVNEAVLDGLNRGISVRALYEAPRLEDSEADAYRSEIETYVRAGVVARVVEELPMKLVIFDHEAALVALTDPTSAHVGYPTNLLVEHAGFAGAMAEVFEQRWLQGRAYQGHLKGSQQRS